MNRRIMLFIAIGVIVVCIVLVSFSLVKSLQPVVDKQETQTPAKRGGVVAINIVNSSQNDSLNNMENGGALNDS